MYDLYPDHSPFWGPAKHDPEHPLHRETDEERFGAGHATAHRDADGDRPDDN